MAWIMKTALLCSAPVMFLFWFLYVAVYLSTKQLSVDRCTLGDWKGKINFFFIAFYISYLQVPAQIRHFLMPYLWLFISWVSCSVRNKSLFISIEMELFIYLSQILDGSYYHRTKQKSIRHKAGMCMLSFRLHMSGRQAQIITFLN